MRSFSRCAALALSFASPIIISQAWMYPSPPPSSSLRRTIRTRLPVRLENAGNTDNPTTRLLATKNQPDNEERPESDLEVAIAWALPPSLSTAAFFLYSDTSRAFHDFIDQVSGHIWSDTNGPSMNEAVGRVLGGPVSLSVSIMLGTLVAMTIQTLYGRQRTLHKLLISQVEEAREVRILIQSFPEPYKTRGLALVDSFVTNTLRHFEQRQVTPKLIRQRNEMTMLLLLLSDMSSSLSNSNNRDALPTYTVGEVYGSIHRFKDIRSSLIAALQTTFPPAHYGNMLVLAATLLFIFLLQTDFAVAADPTSQTTALVTFQLSLCWALLIGTYSMLSAVIYDLLTPWSGIFRTMIYSDVELHDVEDYMLVTDEETKN